jgi:hypothetical protein
LDQNRTSHFQGRAYQCLDCITTHFRFCLSC